MMLIQTMLNLLHAQKSFKNEATIGVYLPYLRKKHWKQLLVINGP